MKYKLYNNVIIGAFLLMLGAKGAEVVSLDVPDFSGMQVVNKKMGMRLGGNITIKTKVHYHEGKPVVFVDNYGFGGHGWTYAPGSVKLAFERMYKGYELIKKPMIPKEEKVVVLGGGVNSLMLANRLAGEEGFSVTVYAEEFSPNILSDVKVGVFIPFLRREEKDDNIRDRLEESSYEVYARWANERANKSVRPIDLYIVDESGKVKLPRSSAVIPMPSIVDIDVGQKDRVSALKYKSFAIDTASMMKEMMEEGKMLGVKFVKRKINTLQECMDMGAGIIFNCIGLELKEKDKKDDEMLVSHTMSIEGEGRMDYAIYVKHENGSYTYLFPGKDNVVTVTGTFFPVLEKNISETENMKHLVTRASTILKKKTE